MQVLEFGSRKIGSAREAWLVVWLDDPNGLEFSPVCGAESAAKMPLDGWVGGVDLSLVSPKPHFPG
jgi:hypothetical protein